MKKLAINPVFSNWGNFIKKILVINGSQISSFKVIFYKKFFNFFSIFCIHDPFPTVLAMFILSDCNNLKKVMYLSVN